MIQVILLGLFVMLLYMVVVWLVVLVGLYFGCNWNVEVIEFYFQVVLVVFIIGVVVWMMWCIWCEQYGVGYDYFYDYDEVQWVDIGNGVVCFEIFEDGVFVCFWMYCEIGDVWVVLDVQFLMICVDGSVQVFVFVQKDGYFELQDVIFEFYEFEVWLSIGYGDYCFDYDLVYCEYGYDYEYDYQYEGLDVGDEGYQDVYECVYVNDIK